MVLQTVNPNGNSAVQCTPTPPFTNWQCVSSLHQAEPDDLTTVVDNSATGAQTKTDIYTLEANAVGALDTINSVTVYHRSAKTNNLKICRSTPILRTHATNYGTAIAITTTWTTRSQTWLTNPNTGLAWTKAEIDTMLAGVALFTTDGDFTSADCTWVYVVIDYTPAAGGAVLRRLLVSVGL